MVNSVVTALTFRKIFVSNMCYFYMGIFVPSRIKGIWSACNISFTLHCFFPFFFFRISRWIIFKAPDQLNFMWMFALFESLVSSHNINERCVGSHFLWCFITVWIFSLPKYSMKANPRPEVLFCMWWSRQDERGSISSSAWCLCLSGMNEACAVEALQNYQLMGNTSAGS